MSIGRVVCLTLLLALVLSRVVRPQVRGGEIVDDADGRWPYVTYRRIPSVEQMQPRYGLIQVNFLQTMSYDLTINNVIQLWGRGWQRVVKPVPMSAHGPIIRPRPIHPLGDTTIRYTDYQGMRGVQVTMEWYPDGWLHTLMVAQTE